MFRGPISSWIPKLDIFSPVCAATPTQGNKSRSTLHVFIFSFSFSILFSSGRLILLYAFQLLLGLSGATPYPPPYCTTFTFRFPEFSIVGWIWLDGSFGCIFLYLDFFVSHPILSLVYILSLPFPCFLPLSYTFLTHSFQLHSSFYPKDVRMSQYWSRSLPDDLDSCWAISRGVSALLKRGRRPSNRRTRRRAQPGWSYETPEYDYELT